MANNPIFNDKTILSESNYLSQLKERTEMIDPLTQIILNEESGVSLEENIYWDYIRVLGGDHVLSDAELQDLLAKANKEGVKAGKDIAWDQGVAHGAAYAIGVIALMTLMSALAVGIHRKIFSKAAQACRGKTGAAKQSCMWDYRAKALEAKAKVYSGNAARHCAKTKDPEKCKALAAQKVNKISNQLRKVKTKLRSNK